MGSAGCSAGAGGSGFDASSGGRLDENNHGKRRSAGGFRPAWKCRHRPGDPGAAPPPIGRIAGDPMKRKASALALLAALGGCVSADKTGPAQYGFATPTRNVPGAQGPFGEPVPVTTA